MQRLKNSDRPVLLSRTKPLSLIIICAILGLIPIVTKNFYAVRLGSLIMCFSLLSISIDLLTGYMGLSAFGNAGFFGLSAYVAAWFTKNTEASFFFVFLIAVLATALVAFLFGFVCSNIWGTTFLIVNMALGQCIWGLAFRWARVTGGEMGMPGITRFDVFGIKMTNSTNYYFFLFVVFILVVFLVYRLVNSPFGLTIHGIRQSRARMSALGFNVKRHKHITYIISGSVAAIGGVLYVFLVNFVSPNITNTLMMSKAFLMALVGGIGTISGGIIGATIIVVIENLLSSVTERWCSVLGLLYIFTAIVSPKGVIGLVRDFQAKRLGRLAIKSERDALELEAKANAQQDAEKDAE